MNQQDESAFAIPRHCATGTRSVRYIPYVHQEVTDAIRKKKSTSSQRSIGVLYKFVPYLVTGVCLLVVLRILFPGVADHRVAATRWFKISATIYGTLIFVALSAGILLWAHQTKLGIYFGLACIPINFIRKLALRRFVYHFDTAGTQNFTTNSMAGNFTTRQRASIARIKNSAAKGGS